MTAESLGQPASKNLMTRLKLWSSLWPSTRTHVIAVLVLAAASSTFAAYVQDADSWSNWHHIGHSLVLWIIVATIAAVRGTWLQSWATTSAVLVVAVLTYFITTRIFGPFEYPPLLSPLLLFWIVLAVAGGLGFATICLAAVNRGWLNWPAVGTIAGLLLGDAINSSMGIPYLDRAKPLDALVSIAHNPDPLLTIGFVGTLFWLAVMLVHHRRHLALVWLIVPGLIVGYVLVIIPDYLLHFT